MISSSGELGGGPILIHTLGNGLGQEFEVFYAIPKNKLLQKARKLRRAGWQWERSERSGLSTPAEHRAPK